MPNGIIVHFEDLRAKPEIFEEDMKCRLEGWKVANLRDDGTDVINESACGGASNRFVEKTKERVHREDNVVSIREINWCENKNDTCIV